MTGRKFGDVQEGAGLALWASTFLLALLISSAEANELLRSNCCRLSLFAFFGKGFPKTRRVLEPLKLIRLGSASFVINFTLLALIPQGLLGATNSIVAAVAETRVSDTAVPSDVAKPLRGSPTDDDHAQQVDDEAAAKTASADAGTTGTVGHTVVWTLVGLTVLLAAKGELCFNYKWRQQRYKEERRRSVDDGRAETSRQIIRNLARNSLGIMGRLPLLRACREAVHWSYDYMFVRPFDSGLRRLLINAVVHDIGDRFSIGQIRTAAGSERYQDALGDRRLLADESDPLVLLTPA